ncbi:MAG: hypothetical protein QOE35_2430 [Actinomycetota bacterium]|jgi:peptidoglycan/xylan/chitin deacetylase (PgdA/CDA1 family)
MRRSLRQVLVGLLALPLSLGPFVAYASFTAEGKLLLERVTVAINPPKLPDLSASELAAARAMAPRYRGAVMALVYHGIGSGSDGDDRFVLSAGRFAEHLAVLRAAGMHTVTAREVATAFTSGRPLPPNAVMISFDDGRYDAVRFADPLLKQAGMRATMFVITSKASNPGVYYAPWSRLEAASRSGRWDLESHTADSHHEQPVPDGRSLPALTSLTRGESISSYRARVRADLARASAAISAHTGRRPVAFAYPFGAFGGDRTNAADVRRVLGEEVTRQYAVAFHQQDQQTVPLVTAGQPRAGLRRLEVGDWPALTLLAHIGRAALSAPSTPPDAVPVPPEPLVPIVAPAPPAPAPAPVPATSVQSISSAPPARVTRASRLPATPTTTPPASGFASTWTPPTRSPSSTPRPASPPPAATKPPNTTPTTKPPVTVPPTTSPPTNCGGQPHGKPCSH